MTMRCLLSLLLLLVQQHGVVADVAVAADGLPESLQQQRREQVANASTGKIVSPASVELNALKLSEKISSIKMSDRPNLIVIIPDQFRFDALQMVQDKRADYAGKTHIRTPNLDRLAQSGVLFETAYTGAATCAPARGILRTGNTLQHTGIVGNKIVKEEVYKRMRIFENKVESIVTYEQMLVEQRGYVAETYGKWHIPLELYFRRKRRQKPVINYNDYDFNRDTPTAAYEMQFKSLYRKALRELLRQDKLSINYEDGQQENKYTQFPYTPIQLDSRYGKPTKTPLEANEGFEKWERGDSSVVGRDSLPPKYTTTGILGQMGLNAIDRLSQAGKPFVLSMNFNAPHPPMISTSRFLEYYWRRKDSLYVPPSFQDNMRNSEYTGENKRKQLLKAGYGYNQREPLQELAAVYYGMIEEVDSWIGKILDKIDEHGLTENTMVVFTSDHGEMLGAHGMIGKGIMLEEATRVPMIMSFPGQIPANVTVKEPVGHMGIFATIMDYLGVSHLDKSDGKTLRRYIEQTSWNGDGYDDRIIVSELEKRIPLSANELSGKLGDIPNLMIRKGDWKLILPKNSESPVVNMMYRLDEDPYEENNLLGSKGQSASDLEIGKAEYLKILLIEWMERMDGPDKLYSDNKYNLGEGSGDIGEIRQRRDWKTVNYWQSDTSLSFGRPVLVDGEYKRNEFLYFGRTNSGTTTIASITVAGPDASYFTVSPGSATLGQNESVKITVSFVSDEEVSIASLDAKIEVQNSVNGVRTIPIVGEF